jgi:predicted metal-dependent hydrolase
LRLLKIKLVIMIETILLEIGEIAITLILKDVKNVHLSVHPPDGRVTLVAPLSTRVDVARAYAISKLGWIRAQQSKFLNQARETPRQFVERESHYLWGQRYLLTIVYNDAKPFVKLDHKRITLSVRPDTNLSKRAEIFHEWHKSLLHEVVPVFIHKWEQKLNVTVKKYFLQRMKTRWGSCNPKAGHIRLNTELVKKPKDLLEYVIVHEMAHLIEPNHSDRFVAILDKHYQNWREAQDELNELPISANLANP